MKASRYNVVVQGEHDDEFVLLNAVSGSVDLISRQELNVLRAIERASPVQGSPRSSTADALRARGYVLESEEEELAAIERLYRAWRTAAAAVAPQFFIILTYACNLSCVYCFQPEDLRAAQVMDAPRAKQVLAAIDRLRAESGAPDPPEIVLFGGEPLLTIDPLPDIVEELLQASHEKGFRTKVISNGTGLSGYLRRFPHLPLDWVQVTVDGPESVHNRRRPYRGGQGSFADIALGVDELLARGGNVALRVNADRENVRYLPELCDFMIDRGWTDADSLVAYIGPVREICSGYSGLMSPADLLREILRLYEDQPYTRILSLLGWCGLDAVRSLVHSGELGFPTFSYCGANTARYCLDLRGDIYTCVTAAGRRDLRVGQFGDTVELDRAKMAEWRSRDVMTISECQRCPVALFCGGGCSYLAKAQHGELMSPYCAEVRRVLQIAVRHFLPRLRELADRVTQGRGGLLPTGPNS